MNVMERPESNVAEQVAHAAVAFEHQRTGHPPESVSVVLSGETLVITLRGALSPVERALAQSPGGAAKLQEFHSQLFASASDPLRREIKRITGVDVREGTSEAEPRTGRVVGVFKTGTTVQVFLLTQSVAADSWTGRPQFTQDNLNGDTSLPARVGPDRPGPKLGGGVE
jgi:uncharacterized protein YbcI